MTIKQQIEQDVKQAMLAGDKVLVTTLRGLKSVILYAEVAANKREEGLDDEEVTTLLSKEAKKRDESAALYDQGGSVQRAAAERQEKAVIEKYLPKQLSDTELSTIVDEVVSSIGGVTQQTMGQTIGAVRAKVGSQADGGRIAAAVKAKLS
jgi:uncharacterized protein YqeY